MRMTASPNCGHYGPDGSHPNGDDRSACLLTSAFETQRPPGHPNAPGSLPRINRWA